MGELLRPDTSIACARLCAKVSASCCVARQRACDRAGTLDGWRGQASEYPGCETWSCAQGRAIREALEAQIPRRSRTGIAGTKLAAELAARRRLRLAGLLDERPTMDEPPKSAEDSAAYA